MRKSILAAALLCALPVAAAAQVVSVTASSIALPGGAGGTVPLASGKLCFAPVNAASSPAGFRVGSVQVIPSAVCGTVTAGVLQSGFSVQPSPAGVYYHIYLTTSYTNAVLRDYGLTPITGSSWTLDTYDPSTAIPGSGTAAQNTPAQSHYVFNSYNALTGTFGSARLACADLADAGSGCTGSGGGGGGGGMADPGSNGIMKRTATNVSGIAGSSDIIGALGFTPENTASKGGANGYAGLDSSSKLPHANLPALLSGDIPNNAANTSGTAGGLSAAIAESLVTNLVTDLGARQLIISLTTTGANCATPTFTSNTLNIPPCAPTGGMTWPSGGAGVPNFNGTNWGTSYSASNPFPANFLPSFGAAAAGIVPLSGGGTTNFLRADGSWAAPPGGGSYTGVTSNGANGLNIGGGETIGSGVTANEQRVVCAGSNDTAAINTALSSGAERVVLIGSCVLGPTGGALVVYSNTYVDASKATVTIAPTSATNLLTNYAALHQTAYKSFADAVVTINSLTVTSATASFSAADLGSSITCLTAGDGTYDFHSYIGYVNNATTITVADYPGATVNPASCSLVHRDSNITVVGGSWSVTGSGVTTAAALPAIKFKSVNNVRFRDANVSGGSSASAYLNQFLDVANWEISGVTLNTNATHQDGVHICGPARNGKIAGIRGISGDDFVGITARDTNYLANDTATFGAVVNLDIDGLFGTSNLYHALTIISAPAAPISDVHARHIKGSSEYNGNFSGFGGVLIADNTFYAASGGYTTGTQGLVDNITVDDVGGWQRAYGVQISGTNVGNVRVNNASITAPTSNNNALVAIYPQYTGAAVNLASLRVTNSFPKFGPVVSVISATGANPQPVVGTVTIDGMQMTIASSAPIGIANLGTIGGTAGPTISDVIVNNAQITNNSTTSNSYGEISVNAYTTVTNLQVSRAHVVHGAGSAGINALVSTATNSTVGNIVISEAVMTAPSLISESLVRTGGTTNTLKITTPTLTYVGGCYNNPVTPSSLIVSGAIVSNISNGASCADQPTLTASAVGLGNVTNDAQTKAAVVPNTAPAAGQIPVGNAGGTAYAPQTASQDCTLSSAGAFTCTKTNNVAFSGLATLAGAAAGDLAYYNGTIWTKITGNNSGTQYLAENASGVPSWGTPGGAGTVTHTAGALTSGAVVIGNGSADVKVDSGCSTDGAGNMTCATFSTAGSGADTYTQIAAPSSPAAGKLATWADSTDLRFHDKEPGGTIGTTSVAKSCTSQVLTAMSAAGVFTCNSVALAWLATQAADTVVMNATGSTAAPTAVAIPTCGDSSHALAYSTSTHAWSCQSITGVAGGVADPGGNGIMVRTALNTTAARSLAAGSTKITVTNADGTAGNPTVDVNTANITSANGTTIPASATLTQTIASGTAALGTSSIASGACATVVTVSATNVATTDAISWTPNASIKAVTGYTPSTNGGLTIAAYPTANNVNFDVCNWTSASITPGAVTLNWRVVR